MSDSAVIIGELVYIGMLSLFVIFGIHHYEGEIKKLENKKITDKEEQPMPITNNNPILQELVIEDMESRLNLGIERYGTGLQAGNGRDMLLDAYEEALDLCVYLRGVMYERDNK